MVFLTRRERFSAAHRLWVNGWEESENQSAFGRCTRVHGHNFELFVTVAGEPDEKTGFIINVHDLSKIVKQQVIDRFDHYYLNDHADLLKGRQPSTEVLAIIIWELLEPHLNNCELYKLKLVETENIMVEYYGPNNKLDSGRI